MNKVERAVAPEPVLISETSVSRAYAKILLQIVDNGGNEISPLVLSIGGFGANGHIPEDASVRGALDTLLRQKGKRDVEDIAYTIFPQRIWQISKGNRSKLFQLYARAFPAYKAMNPKLNGRGLYFERLTMYGRGPSGGNQLEWILSQYEARSGVRRSMFQASIFDPERDHSASAQLGFPCLQHVAFEPTSAGLVLNAFYATQQLFDKAYGNYLGLIQLGTFMAHEMRLPLARLNVNVGVAKLERISKTDPLIAPLVKAARECLSAQESSALSKAMLERARP